MVRLIALFFSTRYTNLAENFGFCTSIFFYFGSFLAIFRKYLFILEKLSNCFIFLADYCQSVHISNKREYFALLFPSRNGSITTVLKWFLLFRFASTNLTGSRYWIHFSPSQHSPLKQRNSSVQHLSPFESSFSSLFFSGGSL